MYTWYSGIITTGSSSFDNNEAGREGGAMYLANSANEVIESDFMHNQAKRGGVIYLSTGVHLTVIYSSFLHNSASSHGGAIYSHCRNNLTINSSRLNSNRVQNNGGGLCLLSQSHLFISGDGSYFFDNQASRGGVYSIF